VWILLEREGLQLKREKKKRGVTLEYASEGRTTQ